MRQQLLSLCMVDLSSVQYPCGQSQAEKGLSAKAGEKFTRCTSYQQNLTLSLQMTSVPWSLYVL